jgi:hypothetical protein
MESGVVSDVESPARRRRVILNLNNQGAMCMEERELMVFQLLQEKVKPLELRIK